MSIRLNHGTRKQAELTEWAGCGEARSLNASTRRTLVQHPGGATASSRFFTDADLRRGSKISLSTRLKAHLEIARLDHSIKNIFVLPGIVVSLSVLRPHALTVDLVRNLAVGFIATTLIACSNYVVNEVLDAPFDRLHPKKRNRPAARGVINIPLAYAQWVLMMLAGMALALTVSRLFAYAAGTLWIMGCLYNIPPFRTKDKMYLDVLSESVNNPLRMLLGWYMVTSVLVPPASLLIAYWMGGCYLMGLKRFSEYRELGDRRAAGAYRRSFLFYTEVSLLGSVAFYASASMLFFGAFIMRYRIELILVFPLIAVLMSTYFKLAFRANSAVQHPETLYKEGLLMLETALVTGSMIALLYFDVPLIGRIFSPTLPAALGH